MNYDEWVERNYPKMLKGLDAPVPILVDAEKLRKKEIARQKELIQQQEADRSCGCVSTPSGSTASSECSYCRSSTSNPSSCSCSCRQSSSCSSTVSSSSTATTPSTSCQVCHSTQSSLCSCCESSSSVRTVSRVSSATGDGGGGGGGGGSFPHFLLNASVSSHETRVPTFRSRWRKSPSSSSSFQPSTPTVTSYSTPGGGGSGGNQLVEPIRGSITSYTRSQDETVAVSSQRSSDLDLDLVVAPDEPPKQETVIPVTVVASVEPEKVTTSVSVQTDGCLPQKVSTAATCQTDTPLLVSVEVQISDDDDEFGEADSSNPLAPMISPAEIWNLKQSLETMEAKLQAERTLRKELQTQLAINFEMWKREEISSLELKAMKKVSKKHNKSKKQIVSASEESHKMESEEIITRLTEKLRAAEEKTSDYFDIQSLLNTKTKELEKALERAATADRLRDRLDKTEAKMFDCEKRRDEDLSLCHTYEALLKKKMTRLMKINRENSLIIEQQNKYQTYQHVDESVENRFARVHREVYDGMADTIRKHPSLIVPHT